MVTAPGPGATPRGTAPRAGSSTALAAEPLGFLVSRAFRRWRRALDARLRNREITYGTWVTLVYLARGGDGMQQRTLAEFMGIEAPTLVRSLDRLERDGLIVRRTPPADRRVRTVHLTAASADVLSTFDAVADETRALLTRGIEPEALIACRQVLSRIIANADAAAAADPTAADETD